MDDHQTILRDVFGGSSESEEDEEQIHQVQSQDLNNGSRSPSWERISQISGLWLCTDFLSPEKQSSLISAIEKNGWFTEASQNQAMRFGDLPSWAIELSNSIREVVYFSDYASEFVEGATCNDDKYACLLPSDLLWREPLFNQLIVNVYQPGEGICAHVDLLRFDDGIAIISLESSCVMHFTRVESEVGNNGEESEKDKATTKIPVYLTPGSLVLMWGEARYLWKHEINRKQEFQKWEGQDIDQKRRTSITLRKLCLTE
ncbi:uncharacterized protein LOC132268848 [Cornus florida]|uniref:uncharacterized protein LOC132268848 n=1 Tax=Cornus florida TaxID=4283 RepID=UPI002897DE59|nr:uncharacterized protein LOC132268848 [Cornus florida]